MPVKVNGDTFFARQRPVSWLASAKTPFYAEVNKTSNGNGRSGNGH
jgi:hypothetical protein